MNLNYSISIMPFLKLVGLNSILKISCSAQEELLPGFMGHAPFTIYTPLHAIWAPQGTVRPSPALRNIARKKRVSFWKEEQELSREGTKRETDSM